MIQNGTIIGVPVNSYPGWNPFSIATQFILIKVIMNDTHWICTSTKCIIPLYQKHFTLILFHSMFRGRACAVFPLRAYYYFFCLGTAVTIPMTSRSPHSSEWVQSGSECTGASAAHTTNFLTYAGQWTLPSRNESGRREMENVLMKTNEW